MNVFLSILLSFETNPLLNQAARPDSLKSALLKEPVISPLVYVKVVFLLIFVVMVIVFAVWAMKRLSPQMGRDFHNGVMKILSSTWLGPKKALHLVQVADRIMLLGMTENSVNLITEFKDPEEVARVRTQLEGKEVKQNFAAAFSSFFHKAKAK